MAKTIQAEPRLDPKVVWTQALDSEVKPKTASCGTTRLDVRLPSLYPFTLSFIEVSKCR